MTHELIFRKSSFAVWITCNVEHNNEEIGLPFSKVWSWYSRSYSATAETTKRSQRVVFKNSLALQDEAQTVLFKDPVRTAQ